MAKHRCHSIEFNDISRNLTREAGAFDEDVRAAWDQGGPSAPRRTTLHDGQDGLDFPTLAISGVISEFARLAGPPAHFLAAGCCQDDAYRVAFLRRDQAIEAEAFTAEAVVALAVVTRVGDELIEGHDGRGGGHERHEVAEVAARARANALGHQHLRPDP